MPTPLGQPHRARQVAESFGADAARYDRTRPPYPDALIRRLVDTAPGVDFLDVGTGTGVLGRQLRAVGCTVLGVEPDPRMAEFARGAGIETEVAAFEAWEPGGRTFDAVVAGTAWHWVDPVVGAARAGSVLRPGGLLAACWHAAEQPAVVAEALAAAYHRVAPDSPVPVPGAGRSALEGYRRIVGRAADGVRRAGGFAEPQEWTFTWSQRHTRASLLDQLPTHGTLTTLRPDQVSEILDAVGTAVDALGGEFELPYTTIVLAVTRNQVSWAG
jgi:SAM-dependent methyltransferase